MTTQHPEALRLADELDAVPETGADPQTIQEAAAELRRLHAYCQELESHLILDCMTHVQKPAENEHVAGDVSKNEEELNMSAQQLQECGNTPYDEGPFTLALPEHQQEALRLAKYVARHKLAKQLDVNEIHGFDYGCDTEAVLLLSDIEVVLAQIATLTATQQPNAWVPLPGTLPEPGKPVLLDIGEKYPIRAMWAAKHTLEVGMDDDSGFGEYDEATDTYYCPEGWYEWNEFEETHWAVNEIPVAWRELPTKTGTAQGQAPAQPAPDEILNMAREQGLPETETEGVFRVNVDDLGRMFAAYRAARAPADSMTAPAGADRHGLPPLPDPDLRDVGTTPRDIKEFLRGYATEYALTALTARAPADSVLEDAARYRWLRDGNDAKHGAAWHIAVNLYGCEWDAAIDAARKQGETNEH